MQRIALRVATLTALAALPACNRTPQVAAKDASVAEVAEKMRKAGAGADFVRPGLWQSTMTVEQLDMPGLPPEMAGRMKTMMAGNQLHGFKTCLTAQDVERPKEDFFAGNSKNCRYDHFAMGGGKIDAQMRCGAEGSSQVMQMAGTYSPDAYQMKMSNQIEAAAHGARGAMTMRMRIDAHRVGDCTGKDG